MDDLGVDAWLALPDVAERLGCEVGDVRRMVEERRLLALKRGEPLVRRVPARFLGQEPDGSWRVLAALQGTLVVLADAGYGDEDAVRWLFAPDDGLEVQGHDGPVAPIDALHAGHKTKVRRRAQTLAF